eukprot:Hpha_TRINITY_DN30859_c0_g1::TRINITY_DN30859_c0_g1_i1::g.155666::m.155666
MREEEMYRRRGLFLLVIIVLSLGSGVGIGRLTCAGSLTRGLAPVNGKGLAPVDGKAALSSTPQPMPPPRKRGRRRTRGCVPRERTNMTEALPPPDWWGHHLGVPDWRQRLAEGFSFHVISKAAGIGDTERAQIQENTLRSLRANGAPSIRVDLGMSKCLGNCSSAAEMEETVASLWPGGAGRVDRIVKETGGVGERIHKALQRSADPSSNQDNKVAVVMEDDITLHPAALPVLVLLAGRANDANADGWMLSFFSPWSWCDLFRDWPSPFAGAVLAQNFWGGMFVALSPRAAKEVHARSVEGYCGLNDLLFSAVGMGCYTKAASAWCMGCNASCHGFEHCPGNRGQPGHPAMLLSRLSLLEHTGAVSARSGERYHQTPQSVTYAGAVDNTDVVCIFRGDCGGWG